MQLAIKLKGLFAHSLLGLQKDYNNNGPIPESSVLNPATCNKPTWKMENCCP